MQIMNCIFDDGALRPGKGPLFENVVRLDGVVETRNKTATGLLLVAGEEKGELVKASHVLSKNPSKILTGCVFLAFVSSDGDILQAHVSLLLRLPVLSE